MLYAKAAIWGSRMPQVDKLGTLRRVLLGIAGLLGAIGVAAAARASHSSDSRNIAAIATIFLAHAPVLVALGLAARGRVMVWSGIALAFGTILFGLDLALREQLGQGAFPGAAPLGGGLMILAWLGLVVAAVLWRPNTDFTK